MRAVTFVLRGVGRDWASERLVFPDASAPIIGWPGRMPGGITPQVEYQWIGPDNTIGFGFSLPLRIFDRNQGEIARTQAEIARVHAVRAATALNVPAVLDADL